MKNLFIYLLLFLTINLSGQNVGIVASSGSTAPATSLYTGLNAWWSCADASAPVLDATANNNDLSANSTPTFNTTNGVNFNSDFDALYITDGSGLQPTADVCSVSFWVKFDVLGSTGGYSQGIVRLNHSVSPFYAVRILYASDNSIHFVVYNASGTQYNWYTGSNVITDITTWHKIVCIAKGNGLNAEIWIDGTNMIDNTYYQSGNIFTVNSSFVLGNTYAGGDEPLLGSLKNVGAWDRAVTSAEVTSLLTWTY